MSFLVPGFLALLPAALGIVIYIHFLRQRPVKVEISSRMLWMRALRPVVAQRERTRMLRSLLLLAQLLVVGLLVFALADPAIKVPSLDSRLVLVVDRSLSMQSTDVRPSRFDRAMEMARGLVRSSPYGTRFSIIDAGPAPRVLARDVRRKANVIKMLGGMRPTCAPSQMAEALDLAFSVGKLGKRDRVILVSDLAFTAPSMMRRFEGKDSPGLGFTDIFGRSPDGGKIGENVAITAFDVRRDAGDVNYRVIVRLTNFSNRPWEFPLEANIGLASVETRRVALGPQESKLYTFSLAPQPDAVVDFSARVEDSLRDDNSATFVMPERPFARVLVSGRSGSHLSKAFSALPRVSVGEVPALRLALDVAPWDIVAFSGGDVPEFDRGALICFGTLPRDIAGGAEPRDVGPTGILSWDDSSPLMRFVNLEGLSFTRYLAAEPPPGASILAESRLGPVIWAVERGGIRLIFVAFDLESSNFPKSVAFPVFLWNAVRWLAPEHLVPGYFGVRCGEPFRMPVPDGIGPVRVTDPAGRVSTLDVSGGDLTVSDTEEAGVYRISWQGRSASFAANAVDATESDIRPRAELIEALRAPSRSSKVRPSHIEVKARPFLVAIALALIALEWWAFSSAFYPGTGWRRPLFERKGRISFGLICLAIMACGLLLTGAGTRRRVADEDIVVLLDSSSSISARARKDALDFVERVASELGNGSRLGLIAFSGSSVSLVPLLPGKEALREISGLPKEAGGPATDIQEALSLGLSSFQEGRRGRLVLMSDGNETHGDAMRIVSDAAAGGIRVDVVPLSVDLRQEVMIERVIAPQRTDIREPFNIRVDVKSYSEMQVKLQLLEDGKPIARTEALVPRGRSVFILPRKAEAEGAHIYEARIEADGDGIAENNRAWGVTITSGAPRALLVTEDPGARDYFSKILASQGIRVDPVTPLTMPSQVQIPGYDLVILDDISLDLLSSGDISALMTATRDMGSGLVVIGGAHSFGLGGYSGSLLEEVLPVRSDAKERISLPSVAILMVIDRSGSMSMETGGASKLDLAREAAISVIELLKEDDQVGVLAFDTEPLWIVPMQPAGSGAEVAGKLGRLVSGGGTELYPAMQEAYRALGRIKTPVKHMIVLSDGMSTPGDFEGITRKLSDSGVTVTTVAVGSDSDVELLRNIARWGKGRAYYTDDIYSIPRILTSEAFVVARKPLVQESFRPRATGVEGPGSGIDWSGAPPLFGYVITSPREGTSLHLVSHYGDPILATMRAGLGRTAAFTSDDGRVWAGKFVGWPGAARMWAETFRYVRRTMERGSAAVTLDIKDGEGRVIADITDREGRLLDFLKVRAKVLDPNGRLQEIELGQEGSGRYVGRFDAPLEGAYIVSVLPEAGELPGEGILPGEGDVSSGGGPAGFAPTVVGAANQYSREYQKLDSNEALLYKIAQATGGKVTSLDAKSLPPSGFGAVTHRPSAELIGAALVLFMLSVGIRMVPNLPRIMAGRSAVGAGARSRYEDVIWNEGRLPIEPQAPLTTYEASRKEFDAWVYLARKRRGH